MIIVTGANGPFGRLVVEHLIRLVPPSGVVGCVRDPAAADHLREWGVEVRRADFGDPSGLPAAFAGAETVFVNATYYGARPEVRGPQQASAITAARTAGARHLVVTSWQDAPACPLPSMADFPATERLVRSLPADLSWTIARVGYGLATALARDVITARRTGLLTAPAGTARVAVATTTDQAEAVSRLLTPPTVPPAAPGAPGVVVDLAGVDVVGWDELAGLAGPEVRYRPVDEDKFRAQAVRGGFPEAAVGQLLGLYAAFRSGWAGKPGSDLAHLLGRRPVSAVDAVRAAVEGWTWS